MDTILRELHELQGVTASIVFDGSGRVVGHRARAVYDRALCEQVSATLLKAIDSIELEQEGWEAVSAAFEDGKLLLRNLGVSEEGTSHVLVIVADATLNTPFATVAIRVATNKLKKALRGRAGASSVIAPGATSSIVTGAPPPSASASRGSGPVLASSGMSWSRTPGARSSAVEASDPATAAFLTRCSKQLARHVGPMAKVYVGEAVRRIAPDVPFSLSLRDALVDQLSAQITDAREREQFCAALRDA